MNNQMVLRASKLARPMVCAASLHLKTPESPSGEDAARGTAFGELVRAMQMGVNPLPIQASNGVYFDEEMHFFAKTIVTKIPAHATSEVKVGWRTRAGITVQGSSDFAFEEGDMLCIDDVKYGFGIVEPVENWQMLVYTIGEIIARNKMYPRYRLRIHQPRPHHEDGPTRSWIINHDQLMAYMEKIEKRAKYLAAGGKDAVTSSQCKYCPGLAKECPAITRAFYAGVDVVMNQTIADDMSEEEISRMLDLFDRIKDVFKIKKESVEELAKARIREGKVIPGYMAKQVSGHRQWKTGVTAESIKVMTGIDIMETSMMTPAKAEQAGVPEAVMRQIAVSPIKGQNLVKKDIGKVADKLFNNPKEG